MGKRYSEIDARLKAFIEAQHVFFVGTAPLSDEGHINLSPKGLDTFRIIGPRQVAYLDYVGSGAETIAHLRENGRIVIMLCAFTGPPNIVRLHGRGVVLEPFDAEFGALRGQFPADAYARALIRVDLERISDSCGFGVPLYEYQGERPQLDAWSDRKGVDGLEAYQREKNARSLDGLPALRWVDEVEPASD